VALIAPVVVEPMRTDDIPAVHDIERRSFSTPWPSYAFEQELTGNRMARYLVARAGERVVGFAGIWLMVDEAHITTFGVDPDWRRRGIGLQMLFALDELSRSMQARRMTLEVRVSNVSAQALYARFGFSVVGRRQRYYTDDGEDALIMSTPALDDPDQRLLVDELRRRLELPGGIDE
jgi:[ribosomal protein S18]-alanine N-acetyltransferase